MHFEPVLIDKGANRVKDTTVVKQCGFTESK
jgi:hypothetical protein